MSKQEYIICAANYYDDGEVRDSSPDNIDSGFVICGRRHHNCIATFAQMFGFPYSKETLNLQKSEEQGFLTSTNLFVDRKEALKIAKKAKQLVDGYEDHPIGLFSEDLY